MSTCDDAFQRLQALQEEKQRLQTQLQSLNKLINLGEHSPQAVLGPEGQLRAAADQFIARLSGPEMDAWVKHAMETEARTDISSGGAQPNNVAQMLRNTDIRSVEDYARLSKALLDHGSEINPKAFQFVNDTYGKERIAELMLKSYGEAVGSEKLGLMLAHDVAPFMSLVERMTRLRVVSESSKRALLSDVQAMAQFRRGSAAPVPTELKAQYFQSLRTALVAERHADLARSRTGQTLRSLRENVPEDLEMLRKELTMGDAFDPISPEVESQIGVKPDDFGSDELFGQISEALDDTNAQRGAEKLEQIAMIIELEGASPKSKLSAPDWFNYQMKLGNLLAKDHQLANMRTQLKTNALSNVAMLVYGPYRQMWENYFIQAPVGTAFNRQAFLDAAQSSWAGVRDGINAIKSSGKEVFWDAARQGKAVFAGNADTFGKSLKRNEQMVVELQGLMQQPYEGGGFANPKNWGVMRNKMHAAFRLFAYEKTGSPHVLEAGLRFLGAQDNVAGLYHHAFKVRNDLEMRARLDGVQLGLDTPKKAEDWIQAEFDKAFYSLAPTEAEVKAYRRQNGLDATVSDDQIKGRILETRVGETYGGPTLATQESIDAEDYSRQMRFQNEPGTYRPDSMRSRFSADLWKGAQAARSNWLVDLAFPYLQSPLMGAFMDLQNSFVTPAIDSISMHFHPDGFTPAQRARVEANWVVGGTILAGFAAMDMIPDMVVGNGPVDPKERQEFLMGLEARGLKPNSIAGVDLPGGIPILNTLMYWKDIKENFIAGNVSNFDQMNAMTAVLTVMTGQLMRQTALGQVNELIAITQNPYKESVQSRLQRFVGYMGASQLPGIGAMRDAAYLTGTGYSSYYQDNGPTKAQEAAGHGDDIFGKAEAVLKSWARGTLGITNAINGVRREEDWLGSKINLPWGMRYAEALKHRFFPQLWPQDKLYNELDKQNLLNPPTPLMTMELDGVGMSDDLQKEFQTAYSHTKGQTIVGRFEIAGSNPAISAKFPFRVDLPDGATYERSTGLVTIPVAPFLEKHIQGKTVAEALRSVINDPLYQALERLPGTSADYAVNDMSPAERRGKPGQILLKAVKSYYGLLATDALVRSGSPDAQEWREARAAVFQQRQEQESNKLQDLVKALEPAQ